MSQHHTFIHQTVFLMQSPIIEIKLSPYFNAFAINIILKQHYKLQTEEYGSLHSVKILLNGDNSLKILLLETKCRMCPHRSVIPGLVKSGNEVGKVETNSQICPIVFCLMTRELERSFQFLFKQDDIRLVLRKGYFRHRPKFRFKGTLSPSFTGGYS